MEIRGEFRLGDGTVIPNNVTLSGREEYLKMIFNGVDGTQLAGGGNFYVGICQAVPADGMTLASIIEPTPGDNNYNRIAVTRDTTGFPNTGLDNGEPYIETGDLVFAPSAALDAAITRLFITPVASASTGELWALGAALSAAAVIWDENTLLATRTVRYRLYLT